MAYLATRCRAFLFANRVLVKATTSINRADFGMNALTTLEEGNVQLCMSVEALKYEA